MKIILTILLCFFSFLHSKDLEEIYLQSGIEAVQKEIENNLQSSSYWQKHLDGLNLEYGYYDSDTFIAVVDKDGKQFHLDQYSNGRLTPKIDHKVLTGLMGDKLVQGDLKTPVGVYEITRKFTPNDTYYGPVAFNLSYPNLLDKVNNRSGGGIWIHGYPVNGGIREDLYNTKGCVVMPNDLMINLENIVKDRGGIVIINEKGDLKATNKQIAMIFANLFSWKEAWSTNDLPRYLSFYDKNFKRYDGLGLGKFKEMKAAIFRKNQKKFIRFSEFSITPYPNIAKETLFRISFKEKYRTNSKYQFDGIKTLYVKLEGDKMRILVEQ